jgi:hypothetical protein
MIIMCVGNERGRKTIDRTRNSPLDVGLASEVGVELGEVNGRHGDERGGGRKEERGCLDEEIDGRFFS